MVRSRYEVSDRLAIRSPTGPQCNTGSRSTGCNTKKSSFIKTNRSEMSEWSHAVARLFSVLACFRSYCSVGRYSTCLRLTQLGRWPTIHTRSCCRFTRVRSDQRSSSFRLPGRTRYTTSISSPRSRRRWLSRTSRRVPHPVGLVASGPADCQRTAEDPATEHVGEVVAVVLADVRVDEAAAKPDRCRRQVQVTDDHPGVQVWHERGLARSLVRGRVTEQQQDGWCPVHPSDAADQQATQQRPTVPVGDRFHRYTVTVTRRGCPFGHLQQVRQQVRVHRTVVEDAFAVPLRHQLGENLSLAGLVRQVPLLEHVHAQTSGGRSGSASSMVRAFASSGRSLAAARTPVATASSPYAPSITTATSCRSALTRSMTPLGSRRF